MGAHFFLQSFPGLSLRGRNFLFCCRSRGSLSFCCPCWVALVFAVVTGLPFFFAVATGALFLLSWRGARLFLLLSPARGFFLLSWRGCVFVLSLQGRFFLVSCRGPGLTHSLGSWVRAQTTQTNIKQLQQQNTGSSQHPKPISARTCALADCRTQAGTKAGLPSGSKNHYGSGFWVLG